MKSIKKLEDSDLKCDICGADATHYYNSDHTALCQTCHNANIASDWELWCEYVNTSGAQSREDWDATTIEQRIADIEACGF